VQTDDYNFLDVILQEPEESKEMVATVTYDIPDDGFVNWVAINAMKHATEISSSTNFDEFCKQSGLSPSLALCYGSMFINLNASPGHNIEDSWLNKVSTNHQFDYKSGKRYCNYGTYQNSKHAYHVFWTDSAEAAHRIIIHPGTKIADRSVYIDLESTMPPFRPSNTVNSVQLLFDNVIVIFHGPNVKHTLWELIVGCGRIDVAIAWGKQLEDAFLSKVVRVVDMQPQIQTLSDGAIKYQPMSLRDAIANFDYAEYKHKGSKLFDYNAYYASGPLPANHALYAAYDVLSMKDVQSGVYTNKETLQEQHVLIGGSACFFTDHATSSELQAVKTD